MGNNVDDVKGRAKEAIGDLSKDEDIKREGQRDQMGAKVKEMAEQVKDKLDDTVDKVKDKMNR